MPVLAGGGGREGHGVASVQRQAIGGGGKFLSGALYSICTL